MLVRPVLHHPPQPVERRSVQAHQAEGLDLLQVLPTLARWDRWWPRTPDRRHYEAMRFTVRLVGALEAVAFLAGALATFLAICFTGTVTLAALPLALDALRRSYASCCF